ncbi:MAG: hypothetical protein MZW92_48890 [Comamonadaceae bacterium]|nr:hypothetical protein [Comamonadaceae bacterium]
MTHDDVAQLPQPSIRTSSISTPELLASIADSASARTATRSRWSSGRSLVLRERIRSLEMRAGRDDPPRRGERRHRRPARALARALLLQARPGAAADDAARRTDASSSTCRYGALRLWDVRAGRTRPAPGRSRPSDDVARLANSMQAPFCGSNVGFEAATWIGEPTPARVKRLTMMPLRVGADSKAFGLLALAVARRASASSIDDGHRASSRASPSWPARRWRGCAASARCAGGPTSPRARRSRRLDRSVPRPNWPHQRRLSPTHDRRLPRGDLQRTDCAAPAARRCRDCRPPTCAARSARLHGAGPAPSPLARPPVGVARVLRLARRTRGEIAANPAIGVRAPRRGQAAAEGARARRRRVPTGGARAAADAAGAARQGAGRAALLLRACGSPNWSPGLALLRGGNGRRHRRPGSTWRSTA